MNNHIYSTLFKTQEREPDRSKEIQQRKESQNTHTHTKQGHVTLSSELQFTGLFYTKFYDYVVNCICSKIMKSITLVMLLSMTRVVLYYSMTFSF